MDTVTFYHKSIRAIDEDVKQLEEHILDGSPADFVQYHKTAAERRGLLRARAILAETFSRATNEDEHDD